MIRKNIQAHQDKKSDFDFEEISYNITKYCNRQITALKLLDQILSVVELFLTEENL